MSGNPIANAQGDNLLYGGEVDPRVNPINMPANAVYIYAPPSGAGALLRKQDGGVSSNFDTLVTDAMARDFSNAQPAANAIDMNSNLINNVLDPVAAQDAATKNYVDTAIGAIDLTGKADVNLGNILPVAAVNFNSQLLSSVLDPVGLQDAATKNYVDTQIGAIPSGMATDFSNAVASTVSLDLNNNSLINVNTIDNNSFNDLTLKADSAWVVVNAGGGLKPLTDGNRALGDLSQRWSQGAFSNSVLVGAPALRTNYNSSSMAVTGTNYTFSQTPGFGFNFNVSTGNINFSSTTGNVDFTGIGGVVDFTGVTVNGLPSSANTALSNLSATDLQGVALNNTGDLIPGANKDLGNPGNLWNDVFCNDVYIGGSYGPGRITMRSDTVTNQAEIYTASIATALPSGATSLTYFRANGVSNGLALYTVNNGLGDGTPTGSINFETGNKTAGLGDSGDISFYIGQSAGGNLGDFKFSKFGTTPNPGDVFTCTNADGSGYWAAPAGGGDLWSDPVNANIIPDTEANNRNLGSPTNSFNAAYLKGLYNSSGQLIFDISSAGDAIVATSLVPNNSTRNLGSTSSLFQNVYSTNFQARNIGAGQTAHNIFISGVGTVYGGGYNKTMPSTAIAQGAIGNTVASASSSFGIYTTNNGGGNSGDILIETGTAAGTRGKVRVDGEALNVPVVTADPTTPEEGDIWLNSTGTPQLKCYVNGGIVVLA